MQHYFDKFKNLNFQQFDRLAPILLVIGILYLCWRLASLLWLWVAPPQPVQFQNVVMGSKQPSIPNITSFSLFPEKANVGEDGNVQLSLHGVMLGSSSHLSSAVIKADEFSDRYRVGEQIVGTAFSLSEVYWDRVVLRHQRGEVRELKFDSGIENGLYQPIKPSNEESLPTRTESNTPVTQNQNGYEVTSQTPSGLRSQLGLQLGDRIISLNGQSITSGVSETQLLEQAMKAGRAKLEVSRGDRIEIIERELK